MSENTRAGSIYYESKIDLSGVERQVTELNGLIVGLTSTFKKLDTTILTTTEAAKKVDRVLVDNAQSVKDLRNNLAFYKTELRQTVIGSEQWRIALNNVRKTQEQLNVAQRQINKVSFKEHLGNALSLERTLSRMAFIGLAGMFYGAYRAAKSFFQMSISAAMDFEHQMSKVHTMLFGIDKLFKTDLNYAVQSFSKVFGQEFGKISSGLYDILSATYNVHDAMLILREGAISAVGGFTSIDTALQPLVGIMKAYNIEASRAGDINDLLFSIVRRGRITYEELASSIGKVIGTASLVGVSLEEVGASISTMTRQSISAREAVTALNNFLLAVVKPSEAAKEVAKKYGVELNALTLQTMGLTNFIKRFVGATEEELAILGTTKRSFKALAAGVNDMTGQFEDLDIMQNRSGASLMAYAEAADDTKIAVDKAKQAIKVWASDLGSSFTPMIKGFADAISGAVDELALLREAQKFNILKNDTEALIDTYIELADKTNRTTDEENRFNESLNALSTIFPSAISGYDNLGNASGLYGDKLKDLLQIQQEFQKNQFNMTLGETANTYKDVYGSLQKVTDKSKEYQNIIERLQRGEFVTYYSDTYEAVDALAKANERLNKQQIKLKEYNATLNNMAQAAYYAFNVKENGIDELYTTFESLNLPAQTFTDLLVRINALMTKVNVDKFKGFKIEFEYDKGMTGLKEFEDDLDGLPTTISETIFMWDLLIKRLDKEEKYTAVKQIEQALKNIDSAIKDINVQQMIDDVGLERSYDILTKLVAKYPELKSALEDVQNGYKKLTTMQEYWLNQLEGGLSVVIGALTDFSVGMSKRWKNLWKGLVDFAIAELQRLLVKIVAFGIIKAIFGYGGSLGNFLFPKGMGSVGGLNGLGLDNTVTSSIRSFSPTINVQNTFAPSMKFSRRDMGFIVQNGNTFNSRTTA